MRDVAFSCDDGGTPFLKVSVWSLLERYKGDEPIRVNVFEGWGGHSAAHKAELEEVVSRFPSATLRYVDVERPLAPYADVIAQRPGSRWNVFTWTPVFTPMLLPDATGTVIHFDIDMLFNADVSALFRLDFANPADPARPYLVSCAYEYDKYGENAGRQIWEKGILPPEAERYFNTGVLAFNAEACREERTWDKIADWYRSHREVADRIEQDAWNALYWDRVLPLHVKWNFHDRNIKGYAHWPLDSKFWLGNAPRDCLEASVAPCILHFWGPKKPWRPSHRPYRRLYHEAMRAVGQKPPREELLFPWHDFKNACMMEDVREALKIPAELYPQLKGDRLGIMRRGHRRRIARAVRHALVMPFVWLGADIAMLVLPRVGYRALLRICDVASSAMYALDRRGRRLALANLHVLRGCADGDEGTPRFDPDRASYRPTRAEARVIRGSYRNMARAVGHMFWSIKKGEADIAALCEFAPAAKELLAASHPMVTVSAHIGCWEILPHFAIQAGHSMMSVAKPIFSDGITNMLIGSRQASGQEIIRADGAFRRLMAGLKAGKSIGLLVDQRVSPSDGGVWVRFCGRPMPVSAAPAFMAAKAKVPIAIAWARPLPDGRNRCHLLDVISPGEARDVWRMTQRCTGAIERLVRRHPSRWTLNYNYFCARPSAAELETLAEREERSK